MKFLQKRGTYSRLLTSLVLLGVTAPFLSQFSYGPKIVNLVFAAVIFSAVWDVARTPRLLIIGLVLGVPAFGARLIGIVIIDKPLFTNVITEGLTVLVLFYALYEIVTNLVTTQEVTADTLRGAISAYLLLGIGWASAYSLVELLQPGAFNLGAGATSANQSPNLLYYSFVVLTTLGFGDITPLTTASRGLTWIEAVTGQLFIATTIARLVGLKLFGETR
ncbi:MAG: hypothetical protein K8R59_08985 [Thermoanaerobaculales bacterium]|nr:hypothetical protein [Thermoanaerobaculales bacterium]